MSLSTALVLFLLISGLRDSYSQTYSQDGGALIAIMQQMRNIPPSWGNSGNPCGQPPWEGITCNNNSRVTALKLYNMGIEGTLASDIGSLTELKTLDLSYNKKLGGTLPPAIGRLSNLYALFLINCNFSGNIPDELGNLSQLYYLTLELNNFEGSIPASLGKLSKLNLLDLSNNKLSGPLPISTDTSPGLDQLLNTKHFHFNRNHLSGSIPEKLFSSKMILLHLLLDHNYLTGVIPDSIGLVQSLESIRLDRNNLNGSVPATLSNLSNIKLINLANNKLTGPMPNLTMLSALNSVDLSNNTFDPSEAPDWITNLPYLRSLVIESGGLSGNVPQALFNLKILERVKLKNNAFNGSLDMGSNFSSKLQMVDFQNNALTSVELNANYNNTMILVGNPLCSNIHLLGTSFCVLEPEQPGPSTNQSNCTGPCTQRYNCLHPYEGQMVFRAPYFQVVTDQSMFELLLKNVSDKFGAYVASISLQNPIFNDDNYLVIDLKLCPLSGDYFNRTVILKYLGLSNQDFSAPSIYGPFYFVAFEYNFPGTRSSLNTGLLIGMIVGFTLLSLGLVGLGIYAWRQKKRVQRAIEVIEPFASWNVNEEDSVEAPRLQGARWFSFDELKKCTNNFPEINVIGIGGYGKVYRGMLSNGQIVAIKREQVGSTQGGLEFKTEIELLSRIHHRNLLELVGFCFQKGERMLVYEFMPNGTLRECLSVESGLQLNWKCRLGITLDAARGLAYLHEHANPPIIHRDVKSTNILLDENLTAKVADFGLSKLVIDTERGQYTTQIKGTLGYMDPEYYTTQLLTGKSDVYSFGVVMLELVTATPPIQEKKYIVREVQMAINKKDLKYYGLSDLMDPILRYGPPITNFKGFVELALQCLEESPADRPTMSEIVKELETMVSNEGLSRDSTSSSARYTPPTKEKEEVASSAFEYSGGYSFAMQIEPK